MNVPLKIGDTVRAEAAGIDCRIDKYLGAGSQGEVYQVSTDGGPLALKWYFPHTATETQRKILGKLVGNAPDPRFLWPIDLATSKTARDFGYLMALRPERYRSMALLMTRKIEPSFRALTTACYHLADSFSQLHTKGLCYRDISFGNVFLDPIGGEILVCDNDNVTVNRGAEVTVSGTLGFMAPELVRGDADVRPSTDTDLFSLAVLLFHMLMMGHPLHGANETKIHCLDPAAMRKLYGTEPIFIFDPDNAENRPVPGVHDNAIAYWQVYPQFVRDRFIAAFTEGLREPKHGRVREPVWRRDMVRLRDAIFYCGHCGAENFYDGDVLKATGAPAPCWSCHRAVTLPPRLRIKKELVMLNHDARLYPHHIGAATWDFTTPVAEVTRHPHDPSIWGLKNLSAVKWTSTNTDGAVQEIEPGRSVRLAVGTRIQFGAVEGEIRF